MVDEVVQNASFRGKNTDEEDPILVAQRFLNIFKQLHIFNQTRKDEFDKMILNLSPNVRGMFASLPGGSLLQEYVDELENKSGNIRDKLQDTTDSILKSATQAAPAASQINKSFLTAEAPVAATQIDANFAKEMAKALKDAGIGGGQSSNNVELFEKALRINDEGRRRDTETITKAITESQVKMAQMFVQHNTLNNNSSSNNNANNIQINTGIPNVDQLVGGIVKAQAELFSDMAKTQTKELTTIISVALKESHQLSTKTIVDAISAFQKENLKVLQQLKYGNFNSVPDKDVLEEFDTERKKKKKNKKRDFEKKEEPKVFSEYALDDSLFEFEEVPEPVLEPEIEEEIEELEQEAEIEEEYSEPEIIENLSEEITEEEPAPEPFFDENFLDMSYFDELPEGPVDLDVSVQETNLENSGWGFSSQSETEEIKLKTVEAEPEEEWEWQDVKDEEETPILTTSQLEEEPKKTDAEFVFYDDISPSSEETVSLEPVDNAEQNFRVLQDVPEEEYEWEYEEEPVAEEATGEDDWEWEYEEEPVEVSAKPEAGEEDWEWDYEEDNSTDTPDDEEWEWDYEEDYSEQPSATQPQTPL